MDDQSVRIEVEEGESCGGRERLKKEKCGRCWVLIASSRFSKAWRETGLPAF